VPRAGLTRDVVVAEAAQVADDVGWERLTLALVAQRLGVRLPSLYKHIDGLESLRTDVAVLAARELGAALSRATVGKSTSSALRALCDAYRGYALTHPGRYAATVRAPKPGDEAHLAAAGEVLSVVFAVLDGYGVTGGDAIDAARMLRAGLHGFAVLELSGGFGLPRDINRSYAQMVQMFDRGLRSPALA
jgi:AcrR family transcriptional regulator